MPHYNPLVRVFPQRLRHRLLLLAGPCAAIGLVLLALDGNAQAPQGFASHVASLSEGGGYFDTDNLISNERSYLQILPDLREGGVRGGAYIGVGPDTNFSYVAAVRPEIAFIVDIRRDNLLLHLLFKALFDLSASRVEYLAHLLGRPLPPAVQGWRGAPIDRLVTYFDRPPLGADALSALRKRVDDSIARTGVALSAEDSATITRFHNRFIEAGLELRFNSIGRPPQVLLPDLPPAAGRDRFRRSAGQLPRLGGRLPGHQDAARPSPDHPRRRRPERSVRDDGHRPSPRNAEGAAVRVLHLQRRVLPLRPGQLPPLHRQSPSDSTNEEQRNHSIGLRPLPPERPPRRRQHVTAPEHRASRGRQCQGTVPIVWGVGRERAVNGDRCRDR